MNQRRSGLDWDKVRGEKSISRQGSTSIIIDGPIEPFTPMKRGNAGNVNITSKSDKIYQGKADQSKSEKSEGKAKKSNKTNRKTKNKKIKNEHFILEIKNKAWQSPAAETENNKVNIDIYAFDNLTDEQRSAMLSGFNTIMSGSQRQDFLRNFLNLVNTYSGWREKI